MLSVSLTQKVSPFQTLDDHRWGFTNVQRRNYMVQYKDAATGGWTDLLCIPPLADL